jgi:hypothetical protein
MIKKSYQRRHLRSPYKETILYADDKFVLKAKALNLSEGGLLVDELPSFPSSDQVPLLLSIPQLPSLKNFNLLKMQTFSKELFPRHIIRVKAKLARRDQLSQNLDNLFKSKFGLEFTRINSIDQKYIEEYVGTCSANLVYLQTLIDSFNTDDETKIRVRTLAKILGYENLDKISQLRSQVSSDYKSLQWL